MFKGRAPRDPNSKNRLFISHSKIEEAKAQYSIYASLGKKDAVSTLNKEDLLRLVNRCFSFYFPTGYVQAI